MAGNLITSLLSLATNLLPSITASSSSSNSNNSQKERAHAAEEDLERLMRTLKWIKATLYDAEKREIIDCSVKLWLKELKKVAYDAEDVLNKYQYEVTRVQVEARKASKASSSHKRKQIEYIVPIPNSMVDRLNKIRSRFDEIAKDREALQLRESDGMRRPNNIISRIPTGHLVDEVSIFGREAEKREVINFLLSKKEKCFSVISIVGKGGLGKTTIAQLVYKDERVSRCFHLCGWVCVSEEFDVKRLIKATIESICKINCGLSELSSLQEKLAKIVKGKIILLVLDDVWNENQSLWELFRVPFKEAKLVRILVTTRNKKVAEIMQTTAFIRPSNLPEVSCWQLFKHYAFSGTTDTVPTHLVEMGRVIMRKCGGLPLAVKSVASLLRHETNEEGWREILESTLWESNPSNDIFPALQISYAHLPTHLKPCLLICSMYPKDYLLNKNNLIHLWISHGYIESRAKRKITEIGAKYYEELKDRSFLDEFSNRYSERRKFFFERTERCKLHDIIHDLARFNSENEHYSVEINEPPDIQMGNIPRETYHLYVSGFRGYENQILQQNLKGLRTLFMKCLGDVAIRYITKLQALRVLELNECSSFPPSISKLKHLSYLGITSHRLHLLPLSIGLLYNLQTLIINCPFFEYLPKNIGDLANLQFLYIQSERIRKLPKSLCSLSNLLRLVIACNHLEKIPLNIKNLRNLHELTVRSKRIQALPNTIGCLSSLEELSVLPLDGSDDYSPDEIGYDEVVEFDKGRLDYVPNGLVNFPAIKTMAARLRVRTIAWLKDMNDLEGILYIEGLANISNLVDAQLANLRNKWKLETLDLWWYPGFYILDYDAKSELRLSLIPEGSECRLVGADPNQYFSKLLECLQPHPNLKNLRISCYPSATLPGWMRDPSSLQSIQAIWLERCDNIQSVPFYNLHTLKYLNIKSCSSIRVLQLEHLPSQIQKLQISCCRGLELITGLGVLNMLSALRIYVCKTLKSLTMDELQLVESTELFNNSSHEKTHIRRQSISSLTRLEIEYCDLLYVLPDGLIPSRHCDVRVHCCGCPDLEIRRA